MCPSCVRCTAQNENRVSQGCQTRRDVGPGQLRGKTNGSEQSSEPTHREERDSGCQGLGGGGGQRAEDVY